MSMKKKKYFEVYKKVLLYMFWPGKKMHLVNFKHSKEVI